LLESELFGHEKGAFTGAVARKDGRFMLANGGTLFLDEIGEISPMVQMKLLRFLQEHEFERVGGTQTLRVDVRIIAATNRSLPARIVEGTFREDLYYRLNVVALEMPSLRARASDIPALARHFVERYARDNGKLVEGISESAMELLVAYDWPGNVRELQNAMERAVVLASGSVVEPRFLPPQIRPIVTTVTAPQIPGATLAEIERYAILETLKATGGSKSRAAEILGICTRTIHYRLHHYNGATPSGVNVLEELDTLGPAIDDSKS
jgi:two-component system response regulator AtoC